MHATWTSLLPAFIVLISAFVIRRLNPSLLIGIITATLIASNFNIARTVSLTFMRLKDQVTDLDNLYLYSFLLFIGIIITLVAKTGGAAAFAHSIEKKLKSKNKVQFSSLLLSSILFIDDYLSNLTVGYVMRPLTDRFSIPRVKLAYLVHSLSGPLVILAPISSWVAMITSQLEESGVDVGKVIDADSFFVYLESIPYVFYSYILFFSIIFIIRNHISYGPMGNQESIAQKTGNLFGGKTPKQDEIRVEKDKKGSIWDILFPFILLISSVFIGTAYMGGYHLFGGTSTLLEAFQRNVHIFFVLCVSGLLAIIGSLIFTVYQKSISAEEIPDIITQGIALMFPAVLMVFLASTLGVILRVDLHAGTYLATSIMNAFSLALLPAILFIVSTIIATITGSSWGTIALMLPITIQMLITLLQLKGSVDPNSIPLLFPILGAIFSGSVCGDHISPISETTIMAATSTGSYPLDHTYTQFFYVLPVIISTVCAFLFSGYFAHKGFVFAVLIPLVLACTLCTTLLYSFNYLFKSTEPNST